MSRRSHHSLRFRATGSFVRSSARRRADGTGHPAAHRRWSGLRRRFFLSLGVATAALGFSVTIALAAVMFGEDPAAGAGDESRTVFTASMTLGELLMDSKPGDAEQAAVPQAAPVGVARTLPALMVRDLHAFGISPAPAALPPPAGREQETESLHSLVSRPEAVLSASSAAGRLLADEAERATDDTPVLRQIRNVNITFYDCAGQGFCGAMANGRRVYQGAAACSYDLPLGTRFYIHGDPTGRIYRCDDRGLLPNTWVDIFWYTPVEGWDWQSAVGRYGTIDIIEWGQGSD